ncbi:MAG: hypothetical protein O6834_10520 [Actinobacteria bacterium]|nr:hypothetical protein [Actinomycetota bacterium]
MTLRGHRNRAEAEHYRLVKAVAANRLGGVEQLVVAIRQGLATIGETLRRDARPSLPTI